MNGFGKILEPFKERVMPRNRILGSCINGYQIYKFDEMTRILELSMSPEDCEKFLVENRMPMTLMLRLLQFPVTLEGVKVVNPIPQNKDGKYYFGYESHYLYTISDD